MKPFGSGAVRFNYQQPQQKNQRQTIDFNQMISVKDQEVMQKREAFLFTINQHKKLAQTHQNAVFSSTKTRFDPNALPGLDGGEMPPHPQSSPAASPYPHSVDLNKTGRGAFDTSDRNLTQSTFGLSFQKGNNSTGFDQMNKTQLQQQGIKRHFLRENPAYGFNSTSQRFSYMKEMQKMGEVPGPGSYEFPDHTTVASIKGAPAGMPPGPMSKQGLNTISSAGTGAFFR